LEWVLTFWLGFTHKVSRLKHREYFKYCLPV
jgi:hypothetical protein